MPPAPPPALQAHTHLTDPVQEGRELLPSGPLLQPQRSPHPTHPARLLGLSFPNSRMEATASEGSLKDARGDRWAEPTTPTIPGDAQRCSQHGTWRFQEGGSRFLGCPGHCPSREPSPCVQPHCPRLCRQPGWGYRGPGSPESRGPSSRHTLASGSVCSAESLSDTRSPVPALFEPDLSDFSSLFWQR